MAHENQARGEAAHKWRNRARHRRLLARLRRDPVVPRLDDPATSGFRPARLAPEALAPTRRERVRRYRQLGPMGKRAAKRAADPRRSTLNRRRRRHGARAR